MMQIGMVGLGRMGANMARRLKEGGHDVVVFDVRPETVALLEAEGFRGVHSLRELASRLDAPRAAWVMVPAGDPTERVIADLGAAFEPGDLIVDGGNSFYKDDVRRAADLAARGIRFVDVGTSGGTWGLERGFCLMAGGDPHSIARLHPAFATLAPGRGDVVPSPAPEGRLGTADQGWLHCGPAGAGHFVKMIHNGIEYGIMQSYAEGFDILRSAASAGRPDDQRYQLDPAAIAELWRRGSVITSWLLDLTAAALARDPELAGFTGHVQDSGEGRWTVEAAVEEAVAAPVLTAALFARFRSRQSNTFGEKILSAMRAGFGGHSEPARGA